MFIVMYIFLSCLARKKDPKKDYVLSCLKCRPLETKSGTSSMALRHPIPHQTMRLYFDECFKP